MRTLPIPLLLLALAACDPVVAGDDAAVAQAIGGVQPALEAQGALLLHAACEDCGDLQELGAWLGDRFAACGTVRSVFSAESQCPQLQGQNAVVLEFNGCDLGVGKAVSGQLLLARSGGSAYTAFDLELAAGEHGALACGTTSMRRGLLSVDFEALAHGAQGGDVLVRWTLGRMEEASDGDLVRDGKIEAQFTGADGVGYVVHGEGRELSRKQGDSLPHAGSIQFQGTDGPARLEFGEETPRTGGILLQRSDGRQETVVVAR